MQTGSMAVHDSETSRLRRMLVTGLLLFVPLAGFAAVRYERTVEFERECAGHLRRAARAGTIELAREELATAVVHLEREGITSGHTSVLWRTPDEDVGYWYRNLRLMLDGLGVVDAGTAPLERTNILLRLHETLIDDEGRGARVIMPPGISVFPRNRHYALVGAILSTLAAFGALMLVRWRFES